MDREAGRWLAAGALALLAACGADQAPTVSGPEETTAQRLGPDTSRTITVLGRPAAIGPIHEGEMVKTDTYALLGYGITEDVLERFAVSLHPVPTGSVEEGPLTDGIRLSLLVAIDDTAVTLDPISWYVGDDDERELVEHGFEADGGANDYFSPNDDPATQTLPIGDGLVVTSPWAEYGSGGCELCQREITVARLRALLTDTETVGGPGNVRDGTWWVTATDGVVVRLDQQYTP